MSDILRIFVIVLLLTVSLAAYFLVANALFPQRVAKTKAMIESMPGRSFGIGLVNFSFFFVIAFALISFAENIGNGFFKTIVTIPALIIILLLVIVLSFSLTSMSNLIGGKFLPDGAGWKQSFWGTTILCFACALPFAGWFLLFPYIGFVGFGAFILALFQREPK